VIGIDFTPRKDCPSIRRSVRTVNDVVVRIVTGLLKGVPGLGDSCLKVGRVVGRLAVERLGNQGVLHVLPKNGRVFTRLYTQASGRPAHCVLRSLWIHVVHLSIGVMRLRGKRIGDWNLCFADYAIVAVFEGGVLLGVVAIFGVVLPPQVRSAVRLRGEPYIGGFAAEDGAGWDRDGFSDSSRNGRYGLTIRLVNSGPYWLTRRASAGDLLWRFGSSSSSSDVIGIGLLQIRF
jgi:hypothetical protein